MEKVCIQPWSHLFINELGEVHPCCFKSKDSIGLRLNDYSLKKARDSVHLHEIRKDLIKGIKNSSCNNCWEMESVGIDSPRQMFSRNHKKILNEIRDENKTKLQSVDLRLGNLCNLACRMCTPESSGQLIDDYENIVSKIGAYSYCENVSWFKKESFWSELLEVFEDVERLHIAGGEPFLIKEHFEFLRKLITMDYAKSISISYNTNLTVLPKEAYELWKSFKDISIQISLDGTGKINDFIRYPSKFKNINQNILKLINDKEILNLKNIEFHTTISIYNVFNLPDLFIYLSSINIDEKFVILNYVKGTPWFDIRILNKDEKNKLRILFSKYRNEKFYYKLVEVMNYLESKNLTSWRREFRRVNRIFDEKRNQSAQILIPDLNSLFGKFEKIEKAIYPIESRIRKFKKTILQN